MISHPVYVRHSAHYIYDIISTMYDNTTLCVDYTTLGTCMISFALQKTSHPLYHTKPQSLWLHIHFRQAITHPVSGITPTVSLSSQPLHWYHTHFFFYLFYFFSFFICGGFCHTLKWKSHEFTCVPHPDPPSYFPLHTLPLGFPSAPGPSACLMHPTWAGDLFHPR